MPRLARLLVLNAVLTITLIAPGLASAQSPTLAVTLFSIPSSASPYGIAVGPDGALWFTEYAQDHSGSTITNSGIGRITTDGAVTEYRLDSGASRPQGIVAGPDGAMWFFEQSAAKIGRISMAGEITEFPIAYPAGFVGSVAGGIAVGSDGALWFTKGFNYNNYSAVIGRITTNGVMTDYFVPETGRPSSIAAGPDGALWINEYPANSGPSTSYFVRMTTSGIFTQYAWAGTAGLGFGITAGPDGALWSTTSYIVRRITTDGAITSYTVLPGFGIAAGPDGALWFSAFDNSSNRQKIAHITTTGDFAIFPTPTSVSGITGIVTGPDGAMWFTDFGGRQLGRFTVPPSPNPLVAAVLPASRSVATGATATAFATVINSGASNATGCGISPVTGVPASFAYQTTDPHTNAVTGTVNTPASIPAGAAQTYVVGFATNAPFVPTDAALGFHCDGMDAAAIVPGVDTLLLSNAAAPTPDIIVEAATPSNDGILTIGGGGAAAFATATINVGARGVLTARAEAPAGLPVTLAICQTDPANAACLAPATPSVSATIDPGATPTFSVFATATGAIPFDPAANRVFVRFVDGGGAIRGLSSVAIRTQ